MKGEILTVIDEKKMGEQEGMIQEDIIKNKMEVTERKKFMKKLQDKERIMTEKHLPFSYRACKDAFIERQERVFAKKGKRIADRAENVKINDFSIDDYGKESRFVLVKKSKIIEKKLLDGMSASVHTGWWMDYQDKEKGYKLSVEVPIEKE